MFKKSCWLRGSERERKLSKELNSEEEPVVERIIQSAQHGEGECGYWRLTWLEKTNENMRVRKTGGRERADDGSLDWWYNEERLILRTDERHWKGPSVLYLITEWNEVRKKEGRSGGGWWKWEGGGKIGGKKKRWQWSHVKVRWKKQREL